MVKAKRGVAIVTRPELWVMGTHPNEAYFRSHVPKYQKNTKDVISERTEFFHLQQSTISFETKPTFFFGILIKTERTKINRHVFCFCSNSVIDLKTFKANLIKSDL